MKKYLKHIAIITFIPLFLCLWGCVEEVRIYPINISQNEVEFENGNTKLTAYSEGEHHSIINAICGFYYSTKQDVTSDDRVCYATNKGYYSFYCILKGLEDSTTYYAKAFAINASGTIYGEEFSFTTPTPPRVKTLSVSEATTTSFNVEIELSSLGSTESSTVDYLGVLYSSTNSIPPYNSNYYVSASKMTKGKHTIEITDLKPNTTYWVRAYVKNSSSSGAYGEVLEIRTKSAPTVTSNELTIIDINSIKLSAKVTSSGTCNVTERGFCYGTTTNPNITSSMTLPCGTGLGTFEYVLSELILGTTYYIRPYAIDDEGSIVYGEEMVYKTGGSDANGYQYVDLGLSVKWATMNIGATSPEDYGNYYAWGETSPKTSYSSSNYNYSGYYPTTLPLNKDAANVNWGGDWRMPTKAEQYELRTKCTWIWTTVNGVKGHKVISNQNGKSIFLPAAGFKDYSSTTDAGVYGDYWSSSLYNSSYSYLFNFNNSGTGERNFLRYRGLSVRAVLP